MTQINKLTLQMSTDHTAASVPGTFARTKRVRHFLSNLAAPAWAATFYVRKTGADTNNCTSAASACLTIQAAENLADDDASGAGTAIVEGVEQALGGGAQGIEGREATGFGSAQEAGADVGADKHGLLGSRIQQASQDDREIQHELPACGFLRIVRDLASSSEPMQRSDQFSDGEVADQQEVVGIVEAGEDGFGARLSVVTLDQRAGVKEVQHWRLPLVTGPRDLISQAAVEGCQLAVEGFDREPALWQPRLPDIRSARHDGQAGFLKISDRDVMVFDFRHSDTSVRRSLA